MGVRVRIVVRRSVVCAEVRCWRRDGGGELGGGLSGGEEGWH